MTIQLIRGDCLEEMDKLIESGVKVDAIIGDLPYGTTACSWDEIIPFAPMWECVNKINNGVFVTTASQPFASKLIMSNINYFKYEMIWEKNTSGGFINAKKRPMNNHENILVFYQSQPTYNPQFEEYSESTKKRFNKSGKINNIEAVKRGDKNEIQKIKIVENEVVLSRGRYPKTVQKINSDPCANGVRVHPTQKPVALYEYLIRTYTNEGDTVLDFTCGSGTTGVACVNTNRNCILIDKDPHWIEVAQKRTHDAQQQMRLPL